MEKKYVFTENVKEIETSSNSIEPEEVKYDGIVEIMKKGNRIVLKYKKNNDFIKIVKAHKYEWKSCWACWCRELTDVTGCYSDRAAEIGNVLLNNGFCIYIQDKEILKKAVEGKYKEENENWIRGVEKKWVEINCKNINNKTYSELLKIESMCKNGQYIIIHVSYYKIIEKFAKENGFWFTDDAKEIIKEYKEKYNER